MNIWSRLWETRWNRFWLAKKRVSRIKCWFVGHDVQYGSPWPDCENDWCDRCYVDWPEDTTTLPDLLQRGYSWLIECHWAWFDRLDNWLSENHGQKLPHWWVY